ncbi:hypothetical protein B0H19DRAFT_1186915 [Mycena capillaripes]|nr:hypothetical protein B0H19DRAFT_1186915 [Mycena capillaripes]
MRLHAEGMSLFGRDEASIGHDVKTGMFIKCVVNICDTQGSVNFTSLFPSSVDLFFFPKAT